jgi:hypothetical protein
LPVSESTAASNCIISWYSKDILGFADQSSGPRDQAFWLAHLKTAA